MSVSDGKCDAGDTCVLQWSEEQMREQMRVLKLNLNMQTNFPLSQTIKK